MGLKIPEKNYVLREIDYYYSLKWKYDLPISFWWRFPSKSTFCTEPMDQCSDEIHVLQLHGTNVAGKVLVLHRTNEPIFGRSPCFAWNQCCRRSPRFAPDQWTKVRTKSTFYTESMLPIKSSFCTDPLLLANFSFCMAHFITKWPSISLKKREIKLVEIKIQILKEYRFTCHLWLYPFVHDT